LKYKLLIPPPVEETITHLSPNLKKKIRSALEEIQKDPYMGKLLRDELKGLRSFRVSRYRIVYHVYLNRIEIQIIDIGPRNIIYERIVDLVKTEVDDENR